MIIRRILTLTLIFLTINMALAADEIHWTITGQKSVTFDWRGIAEENLIGYGLSPGEYNYVTAMTPDPVPVSSSGPFWEATLTGLTENTLYYYSIGNGPEHSFRTPPAPGSSNFNVYAQGNIGSSLTYLNTSAVQALIADDLPAFVVGLGDLTLGRKFGAATVDQHFNDVMVWSKQAAYMPVWGDMDYKAPDDFENYKGRFAFPNSQISTGSPLAVGEDWYWFDYGNVRFITIPEPWAGAWEDWNAKADSLMAEAQQDESIKFIVTLVHRAAYSSGHYNGSSTLKGILDGLGDTYSKYALNINAHSNNYERSFPQHGVIHVTAGTGGANLTQDGTCLWLTCEQPSWSAFRVMHLGTLKLHFTNSGIEGSFICGPAGGGANDVNCTEGSIVDSFTIGSSLPDTQSPIVSADSLGTSLLSSASPPLSNAATLESNASATLSLVTDAYAVFTEPTVSKPLYLSLGIDPIFNTGVTRITGNAGQGITFASGETGIWGLEVRHRHAKIQPWNSDGTLLVLNNDGPYVFLDGVTYQPKFKECADYSRGEDRWHPGKFHPNERINVLGTSLDWFDVVNCTYTREWTLPFAVAGFGTGQGNASSNGRFVALADATRMFIVDMDPQAPLAAYSSGNKRIGPARTVSDCGLTDCSIRWVSVSPSGKYAVVQYKNHPPRVFDVNPDTLALTPHVLPASSAFCTEGDHALGYLVNIGQADMTMNPFDNNEDVIIGQRSRGCPDGMGSVIMVRLKDNTVTALTDPLNEGVMEHISARNLDRPGWVYVSYYSTEYYPTAGNRFRDEIVAVKMDGSRAVERLVHRHSSRINCSVCEAQAVPSPDGKRVLWASNWALNGTGSLTDIKTYVADIRQ